MAGNLKVRALGNWSLGITAVLAILCIAMSILGFRKYEVLQSSTRLSWPTPATVPRHWNIIIGWA